MALYEESRGGVRLEIREDENPISPRDMNANIGTMVCFHSKYMLGDEHSFKNKDDFILDRLTYHFGDREKAEVCMEKLKESVSQLLPAFASEKMRDDALFDLLREDHVILPLYLLDHSGLSMSAASFNDRWDSGQVGWIYADKDTVIREYGEWNEANCEKVESFMRGEVMEYDDYLRGENYIYDLIDEVTEEVIDGGVWTGDIEGLKAEAITMLPEELSKQEQNELSSKLCAKLRKEFDSYIDDVKKLSPQEIVDRAYQITIKYDLMCTAVDTALSKQEYDALIKAPNALDFAYQEWMPLCNNQEEDFKYCLHIAAREQEKLQSHCKGANAR